MFARKSVEHLDGSNEAANSQRNAHVNFAFQSSTIDEEPEALDEANIDEFNLTKIVRPSAWSTEPILSSPSKCELQTVVRWENLDLEVTAQGEAKLILDNISGQTTNLEMLAILGKLF